MVSGVVEYWDGDPAVEIEAMALGYISPMPIRAETDSLGNYSIPMPFPLGFSDSFFIICSPPDGYISSPEYYLEHISSIDTLVGRDFELRPEGLPTYYLVVWLVDSAGEPFRTGTVSCLRNEAGAVADYGTPDYGGRVVFSLYREAEYIVSVSAEGYFVVPSAETVFVGSAFPRVEVWFSILDSIYISPYRLVIFAGDSVGDPVESLFVEWAPGGTADWLPIWTGADGFASVNPDSGGIYHLRAAYFRPGFFVRPNWGELELTPLEPVDTAFFAVLPDTTGVGEGRTLPESSLNAYPNPFNSSISIEFPDEPVVRAGISDISGRVIVDLNIEAKAGLSFRWTPEPRLPAGVYLLRFETSERLFSAKLLYLK